MKSANVDEYIAAFPQETQRLLNQLRRAIRKIVPQAEETICYGIPTFKLFGNLVHFGAYKHHIGFYPTPSAIKAFSTQLRRYKQSKGAVQFPLDEPLPSALVQKIVEYRVKQNLMKS